jgi:protein-S-isoprenylcysteine O-methyltransferase Ste14
MIRLSIFILMSAFIVYASRKSLLHPQSHGFTRFLAWESLLALIVLNAPQWFENYLSPGQLISWLLLVVSIYLAGRGLHLLKTVGKTDHKRSDPALFDLEKTSNLVSSGIYKYIRHPMYASLLFFTWGAFLKNISWTGLVLGLFSSWFLFLTAKREELECLNYFGKAYQDYMQRTKRFIPFLF